MANPFNGSARGKRGKRAGLDVARRADPDFEPKHKDSASAVIAIECGPFYETYEGETRKDFLIPRKSLTDRQGLALFPQALEFEQIGETKTLQTATIDQKIVKVEVGEPRYRLKWKSDKTLLRTNKPDNFGEGRGTRFTRVTSQSKVRVSQVEIKTNPDNEIQISREKPIDLLETL